MEALLQNHALPPKAKQDAIHIAVAAIHRMDYILTWNFKHIANAQKQKGIAEACEKCGYSAPTICTPEELLGEDYDVARPDS